METSSPRAKRRKPSDTTSVDSRRSPASWTKRAPHSPSDQLKDLSPQHPGFSLHPPSSPEDDSDGQTSWDRPSSLHDTSQQSESSSVCDRASLSRSPSAESQLPPGPSSRASISSPSTLCNSLRFVPVPDVHLRHHTRGITCVRFSPCGNYLASAAADATINIHSTTSPFPLLTTLTGHLAGINVIAWAPDSRTLASGSDDKSIRLWNVATGKGHPVPLLGHHNYVYSLAFSPKGNMLVSGSFDEAIFLWDIKPTGGLVMRSLPAHSDPVSGVDFVRDGTMVCSCAADGLIRIWDTMTGQCLKTLVDEDRKPVSSVRWSSNGKYVLAWTLDRCIRLWDYREGRCVKTYQGHANNQYSLSGTMGTYTQMGDSRAFVASGSEDGAIFVWDVSTKEVLWTGIGHDKVVLSLDFQRDKKGRGILASAGLDRAIKLWEAIDSQTIIETEDPTSEVF